MAAFSRRKLDKLAGMLSTEENGVDAFLVWKDGDIVARGSREPFRLSDEHQLFSVTKSFTSVAAGMLIDEGRLLLDDRVVSFFPEYLPSGPSENMSRMTVRDLLTMTAGFSEAPDDMKRHIFGEYVNDFPYSYRKRYKSQDISWVRDFLHTYVENDSGERFLYSDACSLMISAIVQKITGKTEKEFLMERLFSRMGMDDVHWQISPDGVSTGGWGIRMNIWKLLDFALMILHKGVINGERIVSSEYIADMGRAHVATGAASGSAERHFGYQTWILGDDGVFGGIGAFGQMYIIFPELDIVYVQFGSSYRYMKTLGVLVKELPEVFEDREDVTAAEYAMEPYPVPGKKLDASQCQGLSGKVYLFSHNIYGIERIRFRVMDDRIVIGIRIEGRDSEMSAGLAGYLYSELDVGEDETTDVHNKLLFTKVAARAYHTEEGPEVMLDFYETGYKTRMGIMQMKHGLRIRMTRNFGFIPDADTEMIGVLDDL